MQIITIAGNIGRDAELRTTGGGDKVCTFSVAVSNGRDKPPTWWDCSIWGIRAEKVTDYLTKGKQLTVSGRFGTREHEGKTYLQCKVNDFAFQGSRNSNDERPARQDAVQNDGFELDDSDHIPF